MGTSILGHIVLATSRIFGYTKSRFMQLSLSNSFAVPNLNLLILRPPEFTLDPPSPIASRASCGTELLSRQVRRHTRFVSEVQSVLAPSQSLRVT